MRFFATILILSQLITSYVGAQDTIKLDLSTSEIPLHKFAKYFKDEQGHSSPEQILDNDRAGKFIEFPDYTPNFGVSSNAIWIKFNVINLIDRDWYIRQDKVPIDSIQLFALYDQKLVLINQSGDAAPFDSREIKTNRHIFRLFCPTNVPQTFFLRIKARQTMVLPMRITTLPAAIETLHKIDLLDGIYFGIIILILLYNFMVYRSTKDFTFLIFEFYVIALACLTLQLKGLGFEFFWNNTPGFNGITTLFPTLLTILSCWFTAQFLNSKHNAPRLHKLFYFFGAVPFVSFFLNLFYNSYLALNILQINSFIASIYMLCVGIYIYRKGYHPARLFLFGWAFFIAGVIVYLLKDLKIIAYSEFSANGMQIGSTFEIILISMALADRINMYRREKEEAQQQAMQSAMENERLILEQNKNLEKKVNERTAALNDSLQKLDLQKRIVEQKNQDITDSIRYAYRIQTSILPDADQLKKSLGNHFIYYKPKDIVSGDFYFFESLKNNPEHESLIATVDCTGHGVPGAFMTVIANAILSQIIIENNITSPSDVLHETERLIYSTLHKNELDKEQVSDGMDIAICKINPHKKTVHFCGAQRPLWIISDKTIKKIKGNKNSIGGALRQKEFTEHSIELKAGDCLYLFTDGITDQFGGEKNKKFGNKNLEKLLLRISDLPCDEQKEEIEKTFSSWRSNFEQTDDMLLIGIKF